MTSNTPAWLGAHTSIFSDTTIGVGGRASLVTSTDVSRAPAKQPATEDNVRQKQVELDKSLKLIPFEKLDRAQEFANSGDAMPIVFCRRGDNKGGAWVSPALVDTASVNFQQTFLYLVTQGPSGFVPSPSRIYIGKQCMVDLERQGLLQTPILLGTAHTYDPTDCPISGYDVSCSHSTFKLLLDPLSPEVGSAVQFRSVDDYSTGANIKVKPIYPDGTSSPTLMETYVIRVRRTDNTSGTTSSVGTITTSSTGATSAVLTDTYSTGSYTHTFDVQSIAVAQTVKPAYILIEFHQDNAFPYSVDRKASYENISFLLIKGNMYDVTHPYSPPSNLKQIHLFVEEGISVYKIRYDETYPTAKILISEFGPSNKFGDLLLYWFLNSKKFPYSVNSQVLSYDDIAFAAKFHDTYDIFFNGVISNSTNFMSYAQSTAPMFLCAFYSQTGFYRLRPLLPLTSAGAIDTSTLTPKETFSDNETAADTIDNTIIAGTYQKTYFSTEERTPIKIVVNFRKIRKTGIERTMTAQVRYTDYAANIPEEQYDMTEFCTTTTHALTFAKYVLATRRYSTHKITFQTARNVWASSELSPTQLIAVQLTRTNSAGDYVTETNHYLVDSLEYEQTGVVTISATHFPLNGSGASIISNSIATGSFEVIV